MRDWVKRCCGLVGVAMAGLFGARGAVAADAQVRPNIIFILTDDLGYGDVGAFFQDLRRKAGDRSHPWHVTPALDTLASQGMRLTDHYCAAPVCAPSRASILLGVNQGHSNVRDNQFDKALEANHTLGTMLRGAGYATVAVGKWGLQGKPNTAPPDWPAHPLNRGFDSYFGYMRHVDGHEHYPKEGLYRGKKEVWNNRTNMSPELDKCYTTDLFASFAKKWIVDHEQAKASQPFFMYLAFDTPHATLELPTQAYPSGGGLKGGLQWLGTPGHMINTASGKPDSYYHPDYANATWDNDHNPATPEVAWPDVYKRYATDVRRIDDAVRDIGQLLKDLKIDDNTVIVFTSDNGPSQESYLPQQYLPTFFDSYAFFEGIKRDCWEGGTRVPAIVRWPGHIAPGQTSTLPCSSPDWMATFAAMAGVAAPARCDGVSLLPTLTGQGAQRTPEVYIEYFEGGITPKYPEFAASHRGRRRRQMQMIRLGDYVGVRYNIQRADDPFEIYNVTKDPKELQNLAGDSTQGDRQEQFQELSLQRRRPGGGVKRPYDDALVPASRVGATVPGIDWRSFAGRFGWVPEMQAMTPTASGHADAPSLSVRGDAGDGGVLFSGYLTAPADGNYTFHLATDTGALLRIHEATVIDADFGYASGSDASASIRLKAGKHAFRLYYVHRGAAKPALKLEWSGPGIDRQAVPASAFSRDAQ